MDAEFFKGKIVLIMGLGRFGGGVDAAEFAHTAGAKVMVTDLASAQKLHDSIEKLEKFSDIEFHLGSHNVRDFENADIIIANPAVPPDNKFLEIARRHNKLVSSQINIFFELCPAPIIGITVANGKSTTTALTAHLLNAALQEVTSHESRVTSHEKVWLSGNIGDQPLLMVLDQIRPNDLVVLEISSFQIEQLTQIQKAPKVSLLTNLMPNHLDRYGTFADYCTAKENIFKFQKLDKSSPALSIFNAEDKISAEWFEKYKNDAGRICIKFSTDDVSEGIRNAFPLPGRANLSNLAAAVVVAKYFGVDDDRLISCLPEFKALPHRLELVGQISGVRWFNDSKATTPESAIVALEAFGQPRIIIAGGYDKNLPFEQLGEKIAKNAKAAILIGQTAPKIASAIRNANASLRAKRSNLKPRTTHYAPRTTRIEIVSSLAEAVQLADRLAVSGDVVLLSPACASYDMFETCRHRGPEFCRLVRQLGA
ncbi:MAG: UDP-N-acetylmuramoyl-L-alanine--D-glutamate ligase [Planctomycetota bacterium]|nr:UDP-N-acetylmuramoyl-L-alanine--D-glutamate ligase [Planctomycetota bacterium]